MEGRIIYGVDRVCSRGVQKPAVMHGWKKPTAVGNGGRPGKYQRITSAPGCSHRYMSTAGSAWHGTAQVPTTVLLHVTSLAVRGGVIYPDSFRGSITLTVKYITVTLYSMMDL